MDNSVQKSSDMIDGLVFSISWVLLLAGIAGAVYTGTLNTLSADLIRIFTSPAPLVTDYFRLGSLGAAFVNAGLCGMTMAAFMRLLPGPSHVNTLAGYFLVIAHAFYGLNFLNMWPCFLAPFLYGLYWKRTTSAAVWTSFVAGVGVMCCCMYGTFTGHMFLSPFFSSPINAGVLAMLLGLVIVPVVSLLTREKNKDEVDRMFQCYERTVTVRASTSLRDDEEA